MLINNPNGTFQNKCEYFYEEYGIKDKLELEDIHNRLKTTWNPAEGFEVLRKRFDNRITFTAFTDNTIISSNVLNILINMIIKTGAFQSQ